MKTFTFTYDFSDVDTATMASDGSTGYMIGTYHKPKIEITIKGKGQLVIDYQAYKKHSKAFKRICDSFKSYYATPKEIETVEKQVHFEARGTTQTVRIV